MNTEPDILAAEAARLKSIYKARKRLDPKLSQERIADECGWAGQSVVSQYMTGKIPLNLPALIKFATVLQFQPKEVSPRLAGSFPDMILLDEAHRSHYISLGLQAADPTTVALTATPKSGKGIELFPIEVWDDETPLGPDEIALPFFKEVELSAGKGSEVMLETDGRKLRFGKRTLTRKGIDPSSAACVTINGNSMEPVLPHGSTAGVDKGNTRIQDGQMYAIDHDGQLRVKLLYQLPGNGLRLRSFNTDEHPDERYEGSYVMEHIRVIGKVFWYSVLI